MASTELKYKTFDELLNDVSLDFSIYSLEGMIDPAQIVKVAQRVNYELGLRIHQPKDAIIDIVNGKAKLPGDFYVLNYANICGKYTISEPVIHGTHTEEVILDTVPNNDDPCKAKACCTPCGQHMYLVQKFKYETRTYDQFYPLEIADGRLLSDNCPNKEIRSANKAKLKDGYLFTNIEHGKVHLNFLGNLEDEDGNLLVLDHPLINEYYEYALKSRILENLYMNGEDVTQKMQLIEQRLRTARVAALSVVNTPDYFELKQLWETNRKAQYGKYYAMFQSYHR
jgi:hypothetical protein